MNITNAFEAVVHASIRLLNYYLQAGAYIPEPNELKAMSRNNK